MLERSELRPVGGRLRRAVFEDAGALLRLIERSVEHGCAQHYGPAQRRAVFLSYAQNLCVDLLGPAETVVVEGAGGVVGVAQFVPGAARLSALFVDANAQGCGHGQALLGWVVTRATARGLPAIFGAMSLNAVGFYAHAGFRPSQGNLRLVHHGVSIPVVPMEKPLGR